jgi:predicted DNA-binding protein YlxM (UPF0122 family)
MTNEKKWVIHLYFNQHKIYAEIAEIEKISLHAIHTILNQRKKPDDKNVDIINSKKRKGEDFVITLPELVPFYEY